MNVALSSHLLFLVVGARLLLYYSLYFSVCLKYFKIGKRKEISHGILHTFTWAVTDMVLWFSIFCVRISLLCISNRLLVNVFFLVAEISSGGAFFQPIIPCPPDLVTQSNRLVGLPHPDIWKNQSIQSRLPPDLPSTSSRRGGWRAHLCPGGPPAKCRLPFCLEGRPSVWFTFFFLYLPPKFPLQNLTPWLLWYLQPFLFPTSRFLQSLSYSHQR